MLEQIVSILSKYPEELTKLLLRIISYKTFQTIENLYIAMGVIELANQCSLNICLETLFSHSETFYTNS